MGQYYNAVAIDSENKIFSVYSLQSTIFRENHDYHYYNGIKLMEHSWIGNSFTDFFSKLIYRNPVRVAWVGDYSDSDFSKSQAMNVNLDFPIPPENYRDFYEKVWGDDVKQIDFTYEPKHFSYRGKYLVNHTKKCYFSLSPFSYSKKIWKVYPISLLTAIGNGQGGGDYYNNYRNYDKVGSWALDVISIEDEAPDCFEDAGNPDFDNEA